MEKSVSMIGLASEELPWVRTMLFLLRHPDPMVSQMVRGALLYLVKNAPVQTGPTGETLDQAR